ncbi:MAG: DoxX family protein [Verrucomicrobiales bacterium]
MKIAALVAGALLGLLFIMSALTFLFKLVNIPELPEGTPMASFMTAFVPTGYMTFVKVIELLGGIFVAIPRTRNLGLLLLGPILVNIFVFHQLVAGDGVLQPMLLGIAALALFLLWVERKSWLALIWPTRS